MAGHAPDFKPFPAVLLPAAGDRLGRARAGGGVADGEVDQRSRRPPAGGHLAPRRGRRRRTPAAVERGAGRRAGDGLAAAGPDPRRQPAARRPPALDPRRQRAPGRRAGRRVQRRPREHPAQRGRQHPAGRYPARQGTRPGRAAAGSAHPRADHPGQPPCRLAARSARHGLVGTRHRRPAGRRTGAGPARSGLAVVRAVHPHQTGLRHAQRYPGRAGDGWQRALQPRYHRRPGADRTGCQPARRRTAAGADLRQAAGPSGAAGPACECSERRVRVEPPAAERCRCAATGRRAGLRRQGHAEDLAAGSPARGFPGRVPALRRGLVQHAGPAQRAQRRPAKRQCGLARGRPARLCVQHRRSEPGRRGWPAGDRRPARRAGLGDRRRAAGHDVGLAQAAVLPDSEWRRAVAVAEPRRHAQPAATAAGAGAAGPVAHRPAGLATRLQPRDSDWRLRWR